MAARVHALAAFVAAIGLAGAVRAEAAPASSSNIATPAVSYELNSSRPASILADIVAGSEAQNFHTIQYFWGGQRWCWYFDGWHGPGYYWCGYRWRRGFGWGGPAGWNHWGWHRGGPGGFVGGRGFVHGDHPGFHGGGYGGGHEGFHGGGHEGFHGGGHAEHGGHH